MKTEQKLSCLLLEDDRLTMDMIQSILIGAYPQIRLMPCFQIAEAEDYLLSEKIDFCILDVNLPDGNTFDWLARISKKVDYTFRIIFITAYSDYAAKAFRFNALDFVVKPFSPDELRVSIDRVLQSIDDESRRLELEHALQNLTQKENAEQRIVLKSQKTAQVVRLGDILYLPADNNYCNFHLANGQVILTSYPLKYYQEKLHGYGFMRIHQSYLVNKIYITSFQKKTSQLVVCKANSLPVAQSRRAEVIAYLNALG